MSEYTATESALWEAIGRWSAYIAQNGGQAILAPPQYLLDAVAALIAERDALRARLDAANGVPFAEHTSDYAKKLENRVDQLIAERDALRTALWEYGRHHKSCGCMRVVAHACDCGLSALLLSAEKGELDGDGPPRWQVVRAVAYAETYHDPATDEIVRVLCGLWNQHNPQQPISHGKLEATGAAPGSLHSASEKGN